MTMRTLLVAVSTVAILAGSSYGALAGHSKSVSKGESSSKVEITSTANPQAACGINGSSCKQPQAKVTVEASGKASATGDQGASYSAGGGGLAVEANVAIGSDNGMGSLAAAKGGASGCAGSGCGIH